MFCNAAALRVNIAEGRAYERAVREYAEGDALERLSWMPDEIQWHVDHPGERMTTGYA